MQSSAEPISLTQHVLDEFHQNNRLILSMPYGPARMALLETILGERLAAGDRILYLGSRQGTLAILKDQWAARFRPYCVEMFAGPYRPLGQASLRRICANLRCYRDPK